MTPGAFIRIARFMFVWPAVSAAVHAQGTEPSTRFELVKNDASARGGTVRVSSNSVGVVITGSVDGALPRWPTSGDDVQRSDRVEVSIADARATTLPPIGWGHQFGYEFLAREEDCNTRSNDTTTSVRRRCVDWFRQQVEFRAIVQRLFVRRWVVVPELIVETFATPAFAALDSRARGNVALLEPSGTPAARFTPGPERQGYTFSLTIPWNALPPMQSTRLSELRVLIDVYTAGDSSTARRSSTASSAVRGDPATFPVVQLSPAREYTVSPCRPELANPVLQNGTFVDYSLASDSAVVYIRPAAALDVRRAIVLDAPARGYQYQPDSTTNTPIAMAVRFWALALGGGEVLCGPRLAYRRTAGIVRSDLIVDATDSLTTRRLAGGDVLVKAGPRVVSSAFGSGQCGACPRVRLEMFHIDPISGAISPAFTFFSVAEPESSDIDIVMSENWRTITVFEATTVSTAETSTLKWRSTTYCYGTTSHTYAECGRREMARPPAPRRVTPFTFRGS